MKNVKILTLLALLLGGVCYAAWDKTKPADDRDWDLVPGDIRANWAALETMLGISAGATDANIVTAYNVKAFGAKGDGTTNDAAEIQAAIDAAETAGGGVVYMPRGRYKISAGLTLPTSVILRGAGMYNTIIEIAADVDGITIDNSAGGFGIADLCLRPAVSLAAHTTQAGIKFGTNNYDFILDNVLVTKSLTGDYKCAYGLELGSSWTGEFRLVRVHASTTYGLYMTGGQAHHFSGCDFGVAAGGVAAYIAGNACTWSNCKFQGSGAVTGVHISGGDAHVFSGGWIEVDTGTASTCMLLQGSRNVWICGSWTVDAAGTFLTVSGSSTQNWIDGQKTVGDVTTQATFSASSLGNHVGGGSWDDTKMTYAEERYVDVFDWINYRIKHFYGALDTVWHIGHSTAGIEIKTGVATGELPLSAGMASTQEGGTAPFDAYGNLIIVPKTAANLGVEVWTGSTLAQRLQVNETAVTTTVPMVVGDNSASKSYGSGTTAWTMTANEAAASLFTVTLAGGAADAVFPAAVAGKMYTVYNNSGQAITFKVTGQTGHAVANGKYAIGVMNATDCVEIYEQP